MKILWVVSNKASFLYKSHYQKTLSFLNEIGSDIVYASPQGGIVEFVDYIDEDSQKLFKAPLISSVINSEQFENVDADNFDYIVCVSSTSNFKSVSDLYCNIFLEKIVTKMMQAKKVVCTVDLGIVCLFGSKMEDWIFCEHNLTGPSYKNSIFSNELEKTKNENEQKVFLVENEVRLRSGKYSCSISTNDLVIVDDNVLTCQTISGLNKLLKILVSLK